MRYADAEFTPEVREQARHSQPSSTPAQPVGLLALQRAVGNRAVTRLVTSPPLKVQRWWPSSSSEENREEDAGENGAQDTGHGTGQHAGMDAGQQEQGGDGDIRDAGAIAGVDTQPGDAGTGGGGGAGPGAAAPSCEIDVRATRIRGLGPLPIYHLFVIYKDPSGKPFFFRGGPSGRGGPGGYGSIKCDHGPYTPGTVDWEPGAPSTTVMAGPAACGKDASFVRELNRIDAASIPYAPTGPNSNSVVRTILNKSGVPEDKPVTITPGWGQIL